MKLVWGYTIIIMTPLGKIVFGGLFLIIIGGVYLYLDRNTTPSRAPIAVVEIASTSTPVIENTATTSLDTSSSTAKSLGYVTGKITIGPNCPVEQPENPCPTTQGEYTSRRVLVYESDKITIKERWKIHPDGTYAIEIEPGTYYIQVNPAGIGGGEKKKITVEQSSTTTIDFDIDTGIR
ncbi:MAG: hypothetical protein JWN37_573 [Candidatus Nomurabacteria bacterium]|nr:hypothetical protein [Candidatus Nomurabacteria bacterium]